MERRREGEKNKSSSSLLHVVPTESAVSTHPHRLSLPPSSPHRLSFPPSHSLTSDARRGSAQCACSSRPSPVESGPGHSPNDSHTSAPENTEPHVRT